MKYKSVHGYLASNTQKFNGRCVRKGAASVSQHQNKAEEEVICSEPKPTQQTRFTQKYKAECIHSSGI